MEESDHPLFSSNIGSTIVTIEAGQDKQQFTVHKDLIVACSPYFKAAFEGAFREAKEKSIQIDDEPETFQFFLDWLYFRRLPECDHEYLDESTEGRPNECRYCENKCQRWLENGVDPAYEHQFIALSDEDDEILETFIKCDPGNRCYLYVFADWYDVPALRRAIIDIEWRCYEQHDILYSWPDVVYALRHLQISTPLCRMLVDEYVDSWPDATETKCGMSKRIRQKVPAEFLFAVLTERAQ
ncbi:hypothetical protein Vi05172_g4797 [Venturia inaequalis]|nr:hypothetical protein Vi05172_g4797 [Venturia inaequalis]